MGFIVITVGTLIAIVYSDLLLRKAQKIGHLHCPFVLPTALGLRESGRIPALSSFVLATPALHTLSEH
jgi:hypothetical protein